MSFELFLQAFAAGEPSGIPADALRAAFGEALSELEEDFWQASYDGDQSSDLFLAPMPGHPDQFHTIAIYRPCADPRLYAALWQLLALPGTLLHFPGGATPLARDAGAAVAMPRALLDSLGAPEIMGSAADILRAIERNQ